MAVTSQLLFRIVTPLCVLFMHVPAIFAAVLPEDRADILFHNYDGDNSTFKGPSILVRKGFKDAVSVWGNYYVDMNSAASIDVVTQGSPYQEERVETSAGLDYLHDKTILSVSVTNSSENDYEADSYSLGLSQDFFGDLSTLTMHYSSGKDDVYQNLRNGSGKDNIIGRDFQGSATHQRFGIGWTQILWKNWIVSLNAESSVDEGYLRNPYRSVRFISRVDSSGIATSRQQENYPTTRNSEAYALKSMTYLPWRAAVKLEARTFTDSWGIKASNFELKYTHPVGENYIFDVRARTYDQTQASFYSELYNFINEFDFRASDKELSTFKNLTIGFGVTYELDAKWLGWFDRGTVNFFLDHVQYDYDNFLDKRESELPGGPEPGSESPFGFDAQITRLFISLWY